MGNYGFDPYEKPGAFLHDHACDAECRACGCCAGRVVCTECGQEVCGNEVDDEGVCRLCKAAAEEEESDGREKPEE